jgi:hypothetical protein
MGGELPVRRMTNSIRPVAATSLLAMCEVQDAVVRDADVGRWKPVPRGKPRNETNPVSEGGDRWVETEWWEDFNKDAKRSARNQVGVQSRACRGGGC